MRVRQARRIEVARWCFFFSSRRRHTRFDCDWSSDVCSSDLYTEWDALNTLARTVNGNTDEEDSHCAFPPCKNPEGCAQWGDCESEAVANQSLGRSEERRVGKEGRSRWSPYHSKKKQPVVLDR